MDRKTVLVNASAAILGICCVVASSNVLGVAQTQKASSQKGPPAQQALDQHGAPMFKVDPFWPKVLPNRWSMQQLPGLFIDDKDHVWFLNRSQAADIDEIGAGGNPPRIDCCVRGPELIELDPDGNVVSSFGGPGYHPLWPVALQTVIVDRAGNVWVGGTGAQDGIVKFSHDGKFLWDFGHRPPKDGPVPKENNQQTDVLVNKGRFNLDQDAHELYIINSKRVLVYDMDTAAFKRGWGGHGMPLSEVSNDPIPSYNWSGGPPPEEKNFVPDLHFIEFDKDGSVYVGERGQNRISIYTKQGKWLKDYYVSPTTPARGEGCGGKGPRCGTTYKLTFSRDPEQKYMYVADGTNNKVWILERATGKTLGSFGSNGRYAGMFRLIDAVAMDSKGNIYTGEVSDGKRIQKFVPVLGSR